MNKFYKYIFLISALVGSFNLIMDILIFINSTSSGERIHPQLMEHWPMNVIYVVISWTLFAYFSEPKQQLK